MSQHDRALSKALGIITNLENIFSNFDFFQEDIYQQICIFICLARHAACVQMRALMYPKINIQKV